MGGAIKSFEGLEFINRENELRILKETILDASSPAVLVIRAPSGFGKSRLTTRFSQMAQEVGACCCMVDPDIQGDPLSTRLHTGYFIQRCAEQLSCLAEKAGAQWKPLAVFAKKRRVKTLLERERHELFSEPPSRDGLYKILFDYAARFFGFWKYHPNALTKSDDPKAVSFCTEYVEDVLNNHRAILIFRESQHADLFSLRFFFRANISSENSMIFEYTTETGEFHPEHQKIISTHLPQRENGHIMNLFRLSYEHLQYLLSKNLFIPAQLTAEIYSKWNGNLRSVAEIQFQIGVTQKITDGSQISNCLLDLEGEIKNHFSELDSSQKMILAVCASHVESISKHILVKVMGKLSPHSSAKEIDRHIETLLYEHKFLTAAGGDIRIENETITEGIKLAASWPSLAGLAEKALREFYYEAVYGLQISQIALAQALRQLFRLCVKTRDVNGLLEVIDRLSREIQSSHDQAAFVSCIAEAVYSDRQLYAQNFEPLIHWAAELAYEVGNWEIAKKLFSMLENLDSIGKVFLACAQQESGDHAEALKLAEFIQESTANTHERLAAELITVLVWGCQGKHKLAREKLLSLRENRDYCDSYLLGYVYRFFEVTDDCFDYLQPLEASIIHFEKFGLNKSSAYSQAALAVITARKGDSACARQLIQKALTTLECEIHDKHLLLNNQAVVELLSKEPNFSLCRKILTEAIRYAGDDFSEATILSNLSIACWQDGDIQMAVNCIEKVLRIMSDPDFADRDVFWGLSFNAATIFESAGMLEESRKAWKIPFENGRQEISNFGYWAFRYGNAPTPPAEYAYLAKFPYHPQYLSHWLLEMDALSLLKKELRQ